MALLSGARKEKNSHLAQHVYDQMKKRFPQSKELITSGSALLATLYATVGDVKKATDLQHQIRQSGVKKKIGLSWTVVNGEIYVSLFVVDDLFRLNIIFIYFDLF